MGLGEFDPGVGWSFGIEIDGITFKDIQELDGVKLELDDIEVKANTVDGKYVNKKVPGRKKAGEITVTRGVTSDKAWNNWISECFKGNVGTARKNGSIAVYDYMGVPVLKFKCINGWPKSVEYGSFKAGDASIMPEKLTIAHEGLEPE